MTTHDLPLSGLPPRHRPGAFAHPRRPRRILALVFPYLSTDLYRRRRPAASPHEETGPLALFAQEAGAFRLVRLDAGAAALGLHQGQPLAEARAVVPDLLLAAHDLQADEKDMMQILGALSRYSPLVGRAGDVGAFIDITGCAHLWGGEAGLLADVDRRFARARLAVNAAIADAPGAAYAMATSLAPTPVAPAAASEKAPDPFSVAKRVSGGRNPGWRGDIISTMKTSRLAFDKRIAPPDGAWPILAPLAVEALRIDAAAARRLRTLGLRTIGDLSRQPRKSLTQRFGAGLVRRLDEARGMTAESINPIAPVPDFSVVRMIAEPISTLDAALGLVADLSSELSSDLAQAGKGARTFALQLYRLDGSMLEERIVFARPVRAADAAMRMFRLKFETGGRPVDPGFGFEGARLSAFRSEPLGAVQHDALAPSRGDGLDRLKDALVNRLGPARVFSLAPVDTHTPERAEARVCVIDQAPAPPGDCWALATTQGPPLRPIAILSRPEPVEAIALAPDGPPAHFTWRRVSYRTARAAGPERILGDWRRGETFVRDYYRIEDVEGRRYWIFREGVMGPESRWFLHGLFA